MQTAQFNTCNILNSKLSQLAVMLMFLEKRK